LIPTLGEVLDLFPQKRFLLDYKGGERDSLGTFERVAEILSSYPPETSKNIYWYVLSEENERRVKELMPLTNIFLKNRDFYKECYGWLLTTGWIGYVPEKCRGVNYGLPMNYFKRLGVAASLIIRRVHAIDSKFIVVYPETIEDGLYLGNFDIDGIFTDHIELHGPMFNP